MISAFIWLGRVFDQRSAHNVDLLPKMVERNLETLNKVALRKRKEKVIAPKQAAAYVQGKHELTIDDRTLKKEVRKWRQVYEPIYQPIRHHFAHNKFTNPSDVADLMSKTNIEQMKEMFGFLHALHEGLCELYLNGRNPLPLPVVKFVLTGLPKGRQLYPGEKAYREAQNSLSMLSLGLV